jgi:hypothetical protein
MNDVDREQLEKDLDRELRESELEFELTPTAEEMEQARVGYIAAFGKEPEEDNEMWFGRAQIYAMCRKYPEVGELLGDLKMDAFMGFGVVDVGLPYDGKYFHVVLEPVNFLAYALDGKIVLNEDNQPDYIGTERLRGE